MLCNLFSLNKLPDVLPSLAVPIYKHQVAMTAVSGALTWCTGRFKVTTQCSRVDAAAGSPRNISPIIRILCWTLSTLWCMFYITDVLWVSLCTCIHVFDWYTDRQRGEITSPVFIGPGSIPTTANIKAKIKKSVSKTTTYCLRMEVKPTPKTQCISDIITQWSMCNTIFM
jgi:hypothetical protein